MNSAWQSPAADLTQQTALLALSYLGAIAITGAKAKSFLQGQLTCDLNEISFTASRLGGYCNPQGRLRSIFRAVQNAPDSYLLVMPRELIPALIPTLMKYGQFDRVRITDASEEYIHIGCMGATAPSLLSHFFENVPTQLNDVVLSKNLILMNVSTTALPQFEIMGSPEATTDCWQSLCANAHSIDGQYWDAALIAGGIPRLTPTTVEQFLPHDLNFPAIAAVSFQKGCYVGQEIVARMHYRGKPKRHLYRFKLPADTLPTAGSAIFGSDTNTEKEVGAVVLAAHSLVGTQEALAVVDDKFLNTPLYLSPTSKSPLERLELPYTPV